MLEILVLLIATIFLAKHGKARSGRRYYLRPVRVIGARALSTLASQVAVATALTGASTQAYRAISVSATWNISGLTATEGPITVGYAYSDYSVTEIKECLDSQAAISRGNKTAQEQANRLVRVVGTLSEANEAMNDGKPIKTRLNWAIAIGDTVQMFAFNENASAALTTGASVHCIGKMFVKDSV